MTEAMTDEALFELLGLDCRVGRDGTIRYYNSLDQVHRVYGPAVEWADGTLMWYQNGNLHRLDGPAVEYSDGSKFWYQNGQLHRLDGPAVVRPDGRHEWYFDGKELTEAEWQQAVASMENV